MHEIEKGLEIDLKRLNWWLNRDDCPIPQEVRDFLEIIKWGAT